MRRFELVEGASSKFWEVEQAGSSLNIRWGRIGTAGQSQTKDFADEAKAGAALDKLVKEKTGKGYTETGVAAGASIGAAAPKPQPKPQPAKPQPESAPQAPAPSAESLDAQSQRVFEAVRTQMEDGSLKPGDKLSAAQFERQYGVSEQGAAMAFERLKNARLLQGWGALLEVQTSARATARELREALEAAASAPAADDRAPEGAAPWLAQGQPLRITPELRALAYASRRHPQAVEQRSAAAAWHLVRAENPKHWHLDTAATDAALRPALQRMLDRGEQPQPGADAEADAVLLALVAFASGSYYYKNDKISATTVVDYLAAQYGLEGAVGIYLAAAQGLQVRSEYDGRRRNRSLGTTIEAPLCSAWSCPLGDAEVALRSRLAAAPQDAWDACVARIEAAIPNLHPLRQPVAALLLPDRPELSNTLALHLTASPDAPHTTHWLLLNATDPVAQAAAAKMETEDEGGVWGDTRMVATLLVERGTEAVPVLERGAEHDAAGDALAAIGTPEAVAALARVASASKAALARLALAADRWPLAALVALARTVAAGGKDAGLLTPSLTRLLRAHGGSVDALRPWLDGAAQGAIDRQLALLAGPTEMAQPEELPRVLAAPPWRDAVRKKAAAVLALEPLALAPVEQWAPGERESARRLSRWQQQQYDKAAQSPQVLVGELGFFGHKNPHEAESKAAAAAIARGDAQGLIDAWHAMLANRKQDRYYWFYFDATHVSQLPPAMAVSFWNAVAAEATTTNGAAHVMASLGLPALPGLVKLVRSSPANDLPLAQHYGAVELAPLAARAFAKLKSVRAEGRAWLLRYPEYAACALIAPALGKPGEARDCAAAALRLLCTQGHEAQVMQVAARYDNTAVLEVLRAVLDENPLDRFPTKRAALPTWWQPRGWHRPELPGGKALPDEALDALGQMLTFPTHEEVYAGIADVRAACTPASLAAFGWDCFTAWLESGAPGKENWALTALGQIGNDDTARKLTPLIRAWPGEAAHARAVTGLDALAGIGTDVALMLLNGIAQKVKFKGLQDKAREKIDAIAEARGLTTEELEDRLAPDLGLDAQGTLRLDFGPRAFRVGFDEALKPYVRELAADGKPGARLADLPKPRASDDAALAKEASERYKLLKKDARTIASQQLLRLEVAMCTRRRWTPELFRLFLAEHPLVRHIVQRLVWGVYEGDALKECFRVAEDGQCTTAEDDPFDLPQDKTIGIPHALELPADIAAAFGQLFADYEILQPFPQLGRDTHALTEQERAAVQLERWKGATVPTGRVLGLVNKGWRRGQAQDGGGIWYFTKPLGDGRVIELTLDPGIIVGMVDEYPEQTLGEVQVGKAAQWGEMQDAQTIGTLGAIEASELIRDMEGLRA